MMTMRRQVLPLARVPLKMSQRKVKARKLKRLVFPLFLLTLIIPIQFLSFQAVEKRPEVRLLDYNSVPGITISPRFQKFFKKTKLDHPTGDTQPGMHFLFSPNPISIKMSFLDAGPSETKLVSQEALNVARTLASSPGEPSLQALQTHVAELEKELQNLEFRLQFMYNQRVSVLDHLSSAKQLVEKLEKV
jgi:hypothetical protein